MGLIYTLLPKHLYSLTYLLSIMKTLNVTFEDDEYHILIKAKKELSWHDFIIKNALQHELQKGDLDGNDNNK